jgi:hypothetical protein
MVRPSCRSIHICPTLREVVIAHATQARVCYFVCALFKMYGEERNLRNVR